MDAVLAGGSAGPGRVSLEQLIALNDEIAALARAGMPLERGLLELGRDASGRLGALATTLGARMSAGEDLATALKAERSTYPPLYRAVVEAGVRAGRLPAALEGLANYARGFAEARRVVGMALWYPLIVMSLAFGLFLFLTTTIMPRFLSAFEAFRLPVPRALSGLAWLGAQAWYWAPAYPLLLVLLAASWRRAGHGASLAPGRAGWLVRGLPWMGPMLVHFEAANFADLLALLLAHATPFSEAIVLCAEASGDPDLVRDSEALAAEVARGATVTAALSGRGHFPPLLRWLLATATHQGDLPAALKHMARVYRQRAAHEAAKARVLLPTLMLFGIGVTATVFYALTLFLPWTAFLHELAIE